MRCSDSTGLGSSEKDLPEVKVWRIAKPSLRAQASQLFPGHRVTVAIVAPRGRVAELDSLGRFTRMGFFYTVRGWVEMDDEQCEQLRRIIATDEDALGHYRESWCFQTRGGGGTRFAFFGCEVRDSALPHVRRQLERIATTVSSQDSDITDFVTAHFHVTPEDESREFVWLCRDGRFTESAHEPAA